MVRKNTSKVNDLISIIEKFFIPITVFGLSVRTANCLNSIRVKYIGDLVQYTEKELLNIRGFGKKCLKEIIDLLTEMGLELGETIPGWESKSLDIISKKYIKKQKANQHYELSKDQFINLLRNIEELDLSVRPYRCFKSYNITYIVPERKVNMANTNG